MELLLAVLIFSIVLAAIQSVFFAALRLQRATTSTVEASLPLERTLEIVKHDLANLAVPGTGVFSGPLQSTPSAAGENMTGTSGGFGTVGSSMQFGTLNSAGSFGSGPIFYTRSAPINQWSPWSEVQRVTYYLAAPTNDAPGMDLIRVMMRNPLPVADDEYAEQYLMSGVQDITFLYFDGMQWVDYWDSTTITTNPLPRAIKFQLQLAEEGTTRSMLAPVELVVPLALHSYTNLASSTNATAGGGG